MERQELIKKIEELPPDRLVEVENFVESTTRHEYGSDQKTLHQALTEYFQASKSLQPLDG